MYDVRCFKSRQVLGVRYQFNGIKLKEKHPFSAAADFF